MGIKILLILFLALASHAKFSRGSKFNLVTLEGKVKLNCGYQTEYLQCRSTFMEPWPYDIIVGPQLHDAKEIEIKAIHRGEAKYATVGYNGHTGKSDYINLGIYNIFQSPLLKRGSNRIAYKIKDRNGRVLRQSSFNVNVGQNRDRRCPMRETYRPYEENCAEVFSVCEEYFKAMNFCR